MEDRINPVGLYETFDTLTPPVLPAEWAAVTDAGPSDVRWRTAEGTAGTRYAAHTSPNYAVVGQGGDRADRSLVSATVAIPDTPGVQLRFSQTYFFYTFGSEYLDGGVLEVAVDGGVFQDILDAGGSFASGGYNGTIAGPSLGAAYNNPLAGRAGWGGSTLGFANGLAWFETVVDLPDTLRGKSVQFRWRMGVTDQSASGVGWYVDTVRVGLPPATIQAVSGGDQVAQIGATYAHPLLVRVLDRDGNPVVGEQVYFTGPSGSGPSMSSGGAVRTDADGYAQFLARANSVSGDFEATATVAGLPSVPFGLTNTGKSFTPYVIAAVGAGPGGTPHVKSYNSDGVEYFGFLAYDPAYRGGVVVSLGDVTGDGLADIVTGTMSSGAPHIKVFDGETAKEVRSFFAFDPGFTGGVSVATLDVNADGFADILIGAGAGGGPHLKVFSGKDGAELRSFFPFDVAFRGGVSVAAASGQIVVGAGAGGGPHVKVYDAATGILVQQYFAFDSAYTGGVSVAAGDFDNDGVTDYVAGQKSGGSAVSTFNGRTATLTTIQPFGGFTGGVSITGRDVNRDSIPDLLIGAGQGGGPRLLTRKSGNGGETGTRFPSDFYPFEPDFVGGVNVG